MLELADLRAQLLSTIRGYGPSAVAFSAGVDSTVVAKAAQLALGDQAVAVTASSPSLASGELEQAIALAKQIGIRHHIIRTDEITDPRYVENAPNRCYYCKSELYSQLDKLTATLNVTTVLNGVNVEDLSDYRPGLEAANEHRVRSPLAECGVTKSQVRALAEEWQLPVWDKPAMPCLASRIAYGEEVTVDRMLMIDRAEQFLRSRGMPEVRVRYHRDGLARIEVPVAQLIRLTDDALRTELLAVCEKLGFKFVTVDIAGFRSGSLNAVIPLESLPRPVGQ